MSVMENWTQTTFRYRDDDGSETGATWRQTAGIDDSLSLDTTYRMRFLITGTHTGGSGSFAFVGGFQYQVDGGTWTNITTTSSNVRAVASADTSWTITDDDATTEQLAGGNTFVAGHMDETGTCSSVDISDTQESEFELVFQLRSADLTGTETIGIRMVDSGSALDIYTATPAITIAGSVTIPGTELLPDELDLVGKTPGLSWGVSTPAGALRLKDPPVEVPVHQLALSGAPPRRAESATISVAHAFLRLVALRGLYLNTHTPTITVTAGGDITIPGTELLAYDGTLEGQAPTANVTHSRAPTEVDLTLEGQAPTANVTHSREPAIGELDLLGYAPTANVTHSRAPAIGELDLLGYAPTANVTHSRAPAIGELDLLGYAPTANETYVREPAIGELDLLGYAPTANVTHSRAPAIGELDLLGYAPTANVTHSRAPAIGELDLLGYAPTANETHVREPAIGELDLLGYAPTANVTHSRAPAIGELDLLGYAPDVGGSHTATWADASDLTLAGKQPTANVTHSRAPAIGELDLLGYAPAANETHVREPAIGELDLLGYAPTANVTHSRAPAIGELTLAGKQPSAAGASPTISPDTAQLGLSGAAPRRDESRSIAIPLGELFLITWRGLNLRGITPTFSIDSLGSDITIPGTELLPYEGTLAGQAPTANVTHSAAPAASDLTLAGKQPVALTSVTMEPAAGSVTLAGQQPTLDASSPIVAPNEATLLLQGTISQPVTQPPITVTPGRGPLTFVGKTPQRAAGLLLWPYEPTVNQTGATGPIKQPGRRALSLASVLPNVIDTTPRNRTPASTARVLEGFNPSLEISQVTEDSSLGLVGKAPSSIVSSPQIPVGRCPLTFTGIAPETSREIAVDQGNLTLTAKTPTRQLSNNLVIEVGQEKTSRVLHGQVPLISSDQSRILTPAAAALILTEQLLYLGRSLTVPARGAFLNGKVPLVGDFIRPVKFPGEADLTLAGQTPSIRLGPRFVLDEGSLTLAGQTVTLDQTRNHVRQPSKQELDLAGTTPVPNETRLRAPGAGSLAFGTKQKTLRPTIRLTRSRKEGARTKLVSLSTDYNLKMLYD